MATYLVTGGAGFIGSSIARALRARRRVRIIDNFSTGKRANVADFADQDRAHRRRHPRRACARARRWKGSRSCSTRRRSRRCRSRWPSRSRTTPSTRPARCASCDAPAAPACAASSTRRRRPRTATTGAAQGRDDGARADLAVRRRKLAGRGPTAGLRPRLRPRDRLPALLQRVRAAPGSALRYAAVIPKFITAALAGRSRASSATARSHATSATSTTSSRRTWRRFGAGAAVSGGVFNIGCGQATDLEQVVALIGDIVADGTDRRIHAKFEPDAPATSSTRGPTSASAQTPGLPGCRVVRRRPAPDHRLV